MGSIGHQSMDVKVNQTISLDASLSKDPDGNRLSYYWFFYPEAGYAPEARVGDVAIKGASTPTASITIKSRCRPRWDFGYPDDCPNSGVAHVILAVTDSGSPALTSYRRIIFNISKE
jgi:hypothetical protein